MPLHLWLFLRYRRWDLKLSRCGRRRRATTLRLLPRQQQDPFLAPLRSMLRRSASSGHRPLASNRDLMERGTNRKGVLATPDPVLRRRLQRPRRARFGS